MAHKRSKITKIKKLTEYGIHIWAILIIANAALVYAFHFSTQAAQNTKKEDQVTIAQNDQDDPNRQIPMLDLSFTIPGIGSGGGTMKPKRITRSVTVYLYTPDANSLNENVKPLYVINSTATYDNNPKSPTYTAFTNHALPLGKDVKDGDYQIAFRTDESLRTIIKDRRDDVGGKMISLMGSSVPQNLPLQTVLMGDTIPKEGDNKIDISDYNAFINCYGEKNKSEFCLKNNYGDFDDNGVVDGIDFNILARTYNTLIQQGQDIPQVTPVPSPTITKPTVTQRVSPTTVIKNKITTQPTISSKPTGKTEAKETKSSGGSPLLGIIFFLLLLGVLGVLAFLFFKNDAFKQKVLVLLHKTPPQTTEENTSGETDTTPQQTTPDAGQEPPPAATPETEQTNDQVASTAETAAETEINPADLAASTEIPVDKTPPSETTPAAPEVNTAMTTDDAKSYYVKKKLPDDAKTGFWLVLTDDNGAIDAHYTGASVEDGFAKIKGSMREENGKKFLEVTELTPEG